jgi:hypothetical protein
MVVNRWFALRFEKPALAAVSANFDRFAGRIAYETHGRKGAL